MTQNKVVVVVESVMELFVRVCYLNWVPFLPFPSLSFSFILNFYVSSKKANRHLFEIRIFLSDALFQMIYFFMKTRDELRIALFDSTPAFMNLHHVKERKTKQG